MVTISFSKGSQITIPAKYRKILGIKQGSKLDIELKENQLVLTPHHELELSSLFAEVDKILEHKKEVRKSAEQLREEFARRL